MTWPDGIALAIGVTTLYLLAHNRKAQPMPTPRLWETDHPYYCTEGNYFKNGMHEVYDSWQAFYEDWGTNDPDLNLVFRWDWDRPDPSDYEPYGETVPGDTLKVYWVLQRKAILRSTECPVTEADEPAVRAWLTERAKTIAAVWAPILPDPTV